MQMVCQILLKIRVTQVTPVLWHTSHPFSLYKKSPAGVKCAYDGQRAVHGLDPVGKAYYKAMHSNANIQPIQPFEYGYVPARRREGAIKQQLILQRYNLQL